MRSIGVEHRFFREAEHALAERVALDLVSSPTERHPTAVEDVVLPVVGLPVCRIPPDPSGELL